MNIPLCDIKANYLGCKENIDTAIMRVINGSNYILGEEVINFEKEFATYCGTKYCVGVDNATDGLFLALKAIGIKEGDEVIMPTFTVPADYEAVVMAGGTPVLTDVNCDGNITVEECRNKSTDKTMAIIAVHMYGNPCEIKSICNYASDNNISVVEDCSHAHGAKIDDKQLGSFGDIGVFSFFPSKILGCFGDGGAVITDNKEYACEISALRNHGRINGYKHTHDYTGYNMRLDAIQAAILREKLLFLNEYVTKRKSVAKIYYESLKNIYNPIKSNDCVWYVYPIRHNKRDVIKEKLDESLISTGLHYPVPIHKQPYYESKKEFPIADELSNMVLSIPMYPELTSKQLLYILNSLREISNYVN